MNGLFKSTLMGCVIAAALAPVTLAAQDAGSPFRVLIPYFEPLEGADNDFGEDASDELRDLISTMVTHQAMSEDDIEDEARSFGYDMDELTCTLAIQMAAQLSVPVVVCGTYTETPDRGWVVNGTVRTVEASEDFVLDEVRVPRRDGDEVAAQQIFQQFDRYNNLVRAASFCAQYAAGQQWDDALRQCDVALEISADATSTRFLRAQILRELGRSDESLEEALAVLDVDPFHEGALELAGYLSAVAQNNDDAREYYGRYLDINPGNVAVRMRVAFDLAQAGDAAGAMDFIEVGLEVDPDNADLWDQYGGFAFRAAQLAQQEYRAANPDAQGLAPTAAEYYREAIRAYTRVFEVRGPDTPAERLRNVVRAYLQLGDNEAAVDAAQLFVEAHPGDAPLWSLRADALHRVQRVEDALVAIDRVLQIDDEYPNAGIRRGSWLMEARMVDEAIEALAVVAERSADLADQAAAVVWAEGYRNGYQQSDFDYAVRLMVAAGEFDNLGEGMLHQIHFWHGHSLMFATIPAQEPMTLASAQAALPRFQEALRLVRDSGDYAATVGMNLETDVVQTIEAFIATQEAIIRRDGGRLG